MNAIATLDFLDHFTGAYFELASVVECFDRAVIARTQVNASHEFVSEQAVMSARMSASVKRRMQS
jgi:hypothetical protein